MVLPTALTVIVVGVFFGVYGLILSDRFHKPSAVVLGATLMVGTGMLSEMDLVSATSWTALGVFSASIGLTSDSPCFPVGLVHLHNC